MRAADLVTALFLAVVAGVVVWDAVRLGIGWGTDGPGSGFFPFWLAVLMLATLFAIFLQALRGPSPRPFVTRERARPVLSVLGPMIGLVVTMQWIGLYVASALYIGCCMRWLGRHSWVATVAVAVGIPIVTFMIFERWFLVPMPKGPLETWLGY